MLKTKNKDLSRHLVSAENQQEQVIKAKSWLFFRTIPKVVGVSVILIQTRVKL